MPIRIRCPNGHLLEVKQKYAGRVGLCPRCHVRVRVPTLDELYDEQIIAVLDRPRPADVEEEASDQHVLDVPPKDGSGISLTGSSMLRKQKVCPQCYHVASFSFTHCPTCGTPLSRDPSDKAEESGSSGEPEAKGPDGG